MGSNPSIFPAKSRDRDDLTVDFFGGAMIQSSKFLQLMLPLKSIEWLIFFGTWRHTRNICGSKLQLQSELDILLHPDVAHLFCSFW